MSKEQTPITAEEFLKGKSIDNGSNHNWKDPSNDPRTSDLMEQYAQYREMKAVQEALKEIQKYSYSHIGQLDGVKITPSRRDILSFIETEVLPKHR